MGKKKKDMSLEEAKSVIAKHLGSKGGSARSAKLTTEERKLSAQKAAQARWKDHVKKADLK